MTITKIKEYALASVGFVILLTPSIIAHYLGRYLVNLIWTAIANRKK